MIKDIALVSMEDGDKQWHLFPQSILSVCAGKTKVVSKKTHSNDLVNLVSWKSLNKMKFKMTIFK